MGFRPIIGRNVADKVRSTLRSYRNFLYHPNSKIEDFNSKKHTPQKKALFWGGGEITRPLNPGITWAGNIGNHFYQNKITTVNIVCCMLRIIINLQMSNGERKNLWKIKERSKFKTRGPFVVDHVYKCFSKWERYNSFSHMVWSAFES